MSISFTVNCARRDVDVPADTALLCVLRNDLEIGSPQFGCGLSQCGACSVLVDGKEVHSCVVAVGRHRPESRTRTKREGVTH